MIIRTLIAAAAGLTLLAGCSTTIDRDGSVDDLVDDGVARSVAECMVDGWVELLGDERMIALSDGAEASPDEELALRQLNTDCGLE